MASCEHAWEYARESFALEGPTYPVYALHRRPAYRAISAAVRGLGYSIGGACREARVSASMLHDVRKRNRPWVWKPRCSTLEALIEVAGLDLYEFLDEYACSPMLPNPTHTER